MEEYKPKVLGFMTLFYGGDYLKESLLSIRDHVDKMVVAYTHLPSHGISGERLTGEESRDLLYQACLEVLGDKLYWDEARSYPSEAEHRRVKYNYTQGYDIAITIDSDEVMLDVPKAISYIWNNPERYYGIKGYLNFFRSFSYYCEDGFRPVRGENLRREGNAQNLECPLTILHFSFCQRREIMELKFKSFGHSSEVRYDYLDGVFYQWYPKSNTKWLHSVSLQIWEEARWFDRMLMPDYMKKHKYFNLHLVP